MASDSKLFLAGSSTSESAPDIFRATGRPLGDNPFPKDHPAHERFESATRQAGISIADLAGSVINFQPTHPRDPIKYLYRLRLSRFAILAEALARTVGNDSETAEWFEIRITDLAKRNLDEFMEWTESTEAGHGISPLFGSGCDAADLRQCLTFDLLGIVSRYRREIATNLDSKSSEMAPQALVLAVGKTSGMAVSPSVLTPEVDLPETVLDGKTVVSLNPLSKSGLSRETRKLDLERINEWREEVGCTTNRLLARELETSPRVARSLMNGGPYHGVPVLTKLANKMKLDGPEDLYQE